ncbi:hypothetical protein F4560_000626 [Saccharothrix ecbatanensis]|uniref:Signal transduction histidine kinase n=1 Tax=Saccharothrix ecbatanensis TaxID=1105145 RepID=A0A7W9HF80_9PSEU|nr:hypothetical protein [Saccharothrix ecbatanensis]MBB5800858.1 hypothetical protein [Saccharothrix ecbatanensis]
MDDDQLGRQTTAQLQRGLRISMFVVAGAILFGLGLLNLARNLDEYDLPVVQLGAFAMLAAVLVGVAAQVVLRRPRVVSHRVAIAVVLAASVLSYLALPSGRTSSEVDWVFGAANWVGLAVLLDRPLRTAVAFLVTHELLALANLLLLHDVGLRSLSRFATGSVSVFCFPLCVAVVAAVLHRIGTAAAVATQELERVRTAEAVAVAAHRRRAQRFAELAGTTVPLLEGLADRSLAPSDPAVQRRSAIEAARMRRLLAESDTVENPLLHELRHCADIADRKGVEVELDARGRWPVPPVAVRRALTDAALTALATADSWARVTVVGDDDLVSVNVVADVAEDIGTGYGVAGDGAIEDWGETGAPATVESDVRVETFRTGGTVWTEARWKPTAS